MRAASEAERRRLNERFAALCAIPSPSGQEEAVRDEVVAQLRRAGFSTQVDAKGNVLATRRAADTAASDRRAVLLCAHLDTVPHPGVPIEPVLVDAGWENGHPAILGADNKAAVAVLLQVAERIGIEDAPLDVELLLTVEEEVALAGAKAFDVSALRSDVAYVYDHATPIGEIVVASPTYYRIEAELRGRAAHAGIRPQDGRSAIVAAAHAITAMRHGRLDDETTANVGWIEGGAAGATNVVPERCRVLAEVRSLDPSKAETVVAELVDHLHDAANDPACECDLDVTVQGLFDGYRHRPDAPGVLAAQRALQACGYTPSLIASGGGSDANALVAAGLHCVCLANGTERNHEPTERVSVAALEGMLDVTYALLDELAADDGG